MTTSEASDPRVELGDPRVRANILRELGADAVRPVPARALLVVPLVLAISVTPRPHANDGLALVDPATGRSVPLPLRTRGAAAESQPE